MAPWKIARVGSPRLCHASRWPRAAARQSCDGKRCEMLVSRGGTEPRRLQPRALNDLTTTLLHVAHRFFYQRNHYTLPSPSGCGGR